MSPSARRFSHTIGRSPRILAVIHHVASTAAAAASPATTPNVTLSPLTIGSAGGGQAHENRQPMLAVNFCIALQGEFPAFD